MRPPPSRSTARTTSSVTADPVNGSEELAPRGSATAPPAVPELRLPVLDWRPVVVVGQGVVVPVTADVGVLANAVVDVALEPTVVEVVLAPGVVEVVLVPGVVDVVLVLDVVAVGEVVDVVSANEVVDVVLGAVVDVIDGEMVDDVGTVDVVATMAGGVQGRVEGVAPVPEAEVEVVESDEPIEVVVAVLAPAGLACPLTVPAVTAAQTNRKTPSSHDKLAVRDSSGFMSDLRRRERRGGRHGV